MSKEQTLCNPNGQNFYIVIRQMNENSKWKRVNCLKRAGKHLRPSRLVFSFASDWLRRWGEFSGPITKQSYVKPQRNPEFLSTLNWKLYLKLRFLYFQNTGRIVGFVSAMLRMQWLLSSLSVINPESDEHHAIFFLQYDC